MKKPAVILSIAFLSLFMGAPTPQFAQDTPSGPEKSDQEKRYHALGLVRSINTVEVTELYKYGSYSSWQTLLAHNPEYMKKYLTMHYPQEVGMQFGEMPEVLPGWSLRLNVHPDGKGYDLMLQDLTSKECAFAAFSNESGVIWHGKAIDCKID